MSRNTNRPENVVRHEHFFPSEEDRENDKNRFDACELENGDCVIWDVDHDIVVPHDGPFEHACATAQYMVDNLHTIQDKVEPEVNTFHDLKRFNKAVASLEARLHFYDLIKTEILEGSNFKTIEEDTKLSFDDIVKIIDGRSPAPTTDDISDIMAAFNGLRTIEPVV